jgi:hypothetical protein
LNVGTVFPVTFYNYLELSAQIAEVLVKLGQFLKSNAHTKLKKEKGFLDLILSTINVSALSSCQKSRQPIGYNTKKLPPVGRTFQAP